LILFGAQGHWGANRDTSMHGELNVQAEYPPLPFYSTPDFIIIAIPVLRPLDYWAIVAIFLCHPCFMNSTK